MKHILVIVLGLMLFSCKRGEKKLPIKDLRYSAYFWCPTPKGNFKFQMIYYIDIKESGYYTVFRNDKLAQIKCFDGFINDTMRNLIDSISHLDTCKNDYAWKVEDGMIYDGFTYCFDYQLPNLRRKRILFVPYKAPSELKETATMLENLIYSKDENKKINLKEMGEYSNELMRMDISLYGRPDDIKLDTSKFIPIKISKE